jgi:hypothetical protein
MLRQALKQAMDAAKGEVPTIEMQGLTHPIANVSTALGSAN